MPKKFNLAQLSFPEVPPGEPRYCLQTCQADGTKLPSADFDLKPRSLPPGGFSFPYHSHRHAEELFVVLEGEMTVRTPEGFWVAKTGDVLFFEKGPSGAHQFFNHSGAPCVYLDLRSTPAVDVCDYPDSGKIQVIPYGEIYRRADAAGYFDGEGDPMAHWHRAGGGETAPATGG